MMDCKFEKCWEDCMRKEGDPVWCDEHCAICEDDEDDL